MPPRRAVKGAPWARDQILFLLQREGPPAEMCKNEVWPCSAPRDGVVPTDPELVPRGTPCLCSTDHQLTGAAHGPLPDDVTQLAVADKGAPGVLADPMEADAGVQVTLVHV